MDTRLMALAVFWTATALTAYTYFVYPIVLLVLAAVRQTVSDARYALSSQNRRRITGAYVPSVSLIFAAYNEEAVMEQKMANCAAIDYPPEKLEVLAGCDGCSDRTVELAESAALPVARVMDLRPRSGKPAVLNRIAPEARGEILVFSDANTMFRPETVRSLVRHFSDPSIGCVCGELKLVSSDGSARSEGAYWRYEVFLKFLESRLNMLLGANGGVFAIRRELWAPLPKHAIIDDFLIAMKVTEKGYRSVYDREAVAVEAVAPDVQHEFHRRIRIGAGNYYALLYTWRLLLPWAGPVFFSYWSHKVMRWLVPFALPAAFATSIALAPAQPWYGAVAIAAAVGSMLAYVGYARERSGCTVGVLFGIPYYFLSMNLALFLGFVRFATGGQSAAWKRTARSKQAGV